jgi:hypothetical protein
MNEIIIEGLNEEDFYKLKIILENYKVSLSDSVTFEDIVNLHAKVKQVVDCLSV